MSKFIPQVWSTRTLKHLDNELVYGNLVNTEYEGEIKNHGDVVHINQVGPIAISDYEGTLAAPEELTAEQATLTIDKAKSFNFKVDDILAAQANINLVEKATERAGYGLANVVDQDIAAQVNEAGIKVGLASAPKEVDADTIYDTLVDVGVALSKANVSKADRFIVLPPELTGLLTKDPRFTRNDTVLANGAVSIGKVAGFDVRESNNVPTQTGVFRVMAGSTEAIAFAGQISVIEPYRPEGSFSDAVKGLYVYGVKVIEPKALACVFLKVAEPATEPATGD